MTVDHNGELSRLLTELNNNYAARGFDRLALLWLRHVIVSGARAGVLTIEDGFHHFNCEVSKLLEFFAVPPTQPLDATNAGIQAIFAFAFGYRLPVLSDLLPLTREPGPNNRALEKIAAGLQERLQPRVPVFAQFEIYRGNPDPPRDWCSAAEEDMSTVAAIKQFLVRAKQNGISAPTGVAVVAHRHQTERCIRVLRLDFGIGAAPPAERYDSYDPFGCQPRVMSPEEYVVSDFVSMAALCLRRK